MSEPADSGPSPTVRDALAPLLADPTAAAIIADYDGTLSPIVPDPAAARPVPGTTRVLGELARRFAVVAVVSGRPLSFLVEQLHGAPPAVRMAGLYGLERRGPDGRTVEPAAREWEPVVHEVAARLSAESPAGVLVEDKTLGVTIHWRGASDAETWAVEVAGREADRTGLRPQPGKMSIELRLPLRVDKGTAVEGLVDDCAAVMYLGDDTGDLPAFAALDRLSSATGARTVAVAVLGPETPPTVADGAQVAVGGPEEAVRVLRWLAAQAAGRPG